MINSIEQLSAQDLNLDFTLDQANERCSLRSYNPERNRHKCHEVAVGPIRSQPTDTFVESRTDDNLHTTPRLSLSCCGKKAMSPKGKRCKGSSRTEYLKHELQKSESDD